jgi:flagellar protein FliO/FliZ
MKISLRETVTAALLLAALAFPLHAFSQTAEQVPQAGEQSPQPEVQKTPAVDERELVVNDADQPAVQLENELTGFGFWDFLRMVLVLGAVIALIYGLFLLLKKIGNPKSGGEGLINLLASQPLNGNRSLHLVQVGTEVFLVGSADGAVSLVSRLEEKETLDRIALYESDRKSGASSFAGTFRSILGDNSENGGEAEGYTSGLFLRRQRDRLKKL